jgi:hypothetical protein
LFTETDAWNLLKPKILDVRSEEDLSRSGNGCFVEAKKFTG